MTGARLTEIAELPALRDFGPARGRCGFAGTCAALFASSRVRFLRHPNGSLVVFRHADLRALAVHPDLGNRPPDVMAAGGSYDAIRDEAAAPPGSGAAMIRLLANQVFFMNPPIHGPARAILTRQLGPRQVAQMQALADEVVARLLDEAVAAGEIDFQADVADQLTGRFLGGLLGMDEAAQRAVIGSVRAMALTFLRPLTPQEHDAGDRGASDFMRLVAKAGQEALAAGNPLVEAMAADLAGLDMADDPARAGIVPANIGVLLAGNLMDAFHTAALGAANCVHVLLGRPEAMAALRADPALASAAAFEGLRLEAPAIFLERWALAEIAFAGVRIPKGATVTMLWGAGNLDPEAFADPLAFDLRRPQRGLTTFGGGGHICPGRHMAMMLAQRLLIALTRPGIEIEPAGPCAWFERSMMRHLQAMPVTIRRTSPLPVTRMRDIAHQ